MIISGGWVSDKLLMLIAKKTMWPNRSLDWPHVDDIFWVLNDHI